MKGIGVIRQSILPLALVMLLCTAGGTVSAAAEKRQKPDLVDEFFDRGPIPRLHIELSPEAMNKLREDGRRYVSATVHETVVADADQEEVVYEDVAVHLKGGAGSNRSVD